MLRHPAAVLIPLVVSLVATEAHAQPGFAPGQTESASPLDREEPPIVLVTEAAPLPSASMRVDVGLFSPIGEIGLVYSRPVHESFAIEVGAGRGFSGLQLSGMGKLRLGGERTKFTPGIGLSLGLPVLSSAVHAGHPAYDDEAKGAPVTMAWLDADLVGVEYRTTWGLMLAASAGVTFALTEGHWDAADLGNNVERFDVLPQARLGIGKTF